MVNEYMWKQLFDERQRQEIEFAVLYAKMFNHGTDGHHRLNIIAKMERLLNNIEQQYDINWEDVDK